MTVECSDRQCVSAALGYFVAAFPGSGHDEIAADEARQSMAGLPPGEVGRHLDLLFGEYPSAAQRPQDSDLCDGEGSILLRHAAIVLHAHSILAAKTDGPMKWAIHPEPGPVQTYSDVRNGPEPGPFRTEQGKRGVMGKDDQPGSTLPRRQLGRALREAREGAGFTLERAAQLMEMGKTSVGRIEKGHNDKVRLRDIEAFGELYGLDTEQIQKLKTLAQQSATKSWWQSSRHLLLPGYNTYLGLESGASRLYFYQPLVMPGLLQAKDYATAIEGPISPTETAADVERRVTLRLQRSAILTRTHSPVRAEFVLHQSVLHTIVGSPRAMATQLRHTADMGTRDNVTVRILPYSAGHPGHHVATPYIMLDFPQDARGYGEPSVVYTETTVGRMFFEDDADVNQFRAVHESLRGAALGEQASRDLLRKTARSYEQ
ncbi:helix-turn-helix domain-containing protein [Nocardia asiatica]|uniref:helix-turn-helix domain-containing protein n=1 Tax=Nocardia asiatica TaxID=209252 RepID=UPI003EDED5CB